VDFKKAFDSISHEKIWVTMMDMGYPLHLIDLLAKLYRKQVAKVKVAGTLSEWFSVKKGARQGCVLSLYLFNIPAEIVMTETLDGFQGGIACHILIENEQLEQVDTFRYLGSLITEDGECMTDFHTRLNRGQTIGASLQKIWKSHSMLISTIQLMKALVWRVAP